MDQTKLLHIIVLNTDGSLTDEFIEDVCLKSFEFFPNWKFSLSHLVCNSNIRLAYGDDYNDYNNKAFTMEELVKLNVENGVRGYIYAYQDKGFISLTDEQSIALHKLYDSIKALRDTYKEGEIDILIQKQKEHDEKEVYSDADFN